MMKTQHFHDVWAGPDNTRLVSKQVSLRLPVHITAKLAALLEIYPQKNRTQLVADLLTAALDDLEKNLPQEHIPANDEDDQTAREIAQYEGYQHEPVFYLGGVRAKYRGLVNRHYKEIEQELGNEEVSNLYEQLAGTKEFLNASRK